jgi:hypothetical protein
MTKQQTWEERFDLLNNGEAPSYGQVYDFIQAELQRQREEIVEMIEGMKEDEKGQYGKGIRGKLWDAYDEGYNGALDDITDLVNKKREVTGKNKIDSHTHCCGWGCEACNQTGYEINDEADEEGVGEPVYIDAGELGGWVDQLCVEAKNNLSGLKKPLPMLLIKRVGSVATYEIKLSIERVK